MEGVMTEKAIRKARSVASARLRVLAGGVFLDGLDSNLKLRASDRRFSFGEVLAASVCLSICLVSFVFEFIREILSSL